MKRKSSCWDGKVDEHLGRRSISAGDVVRKRGRIGGETYVFGLLEEGADRDHWVVTWEGEEEGSETFGTHRAESLRIKGRADASTKAYLKRIRPPLKEENSAEGAVVLVAELYIIYAALRSATSPRLPRTWHGP